MGELFYHFETPVVNCLFPFSIWWSDFGSIRKEHLFFCVLHAHFQQWSAITCSEGLYLKWKKKYFASIWELRKAVVVLTEKFFLIFA